MAAIPKIIFSLLNINSFRDIDRSKIFFFAQQQWNIFVRKVSRYGDSGILNVISLLDFHS